MADLIMAGLSAQMTDQRGAYNILVDAGDGRFIRVQVKATRELRATPQRTSYTPAYLFHIKRRGRQGRKRFKAGEFDLLALVAMDIRTVAYMPFDDSFPVCLCLRPPGTKPAKHATRLENIDQFPLAAALKRLLPAAA